MYPILQPGALVAIDENRRKIASGGWSNEIDRPIYFLEHRNGLRADGVLFVEGRLPVLPHPASHKEPLIFDQTGIDVIGQVVAVAMPLDARLGRALPCDKMSIDLGSLPIPFTRFDPLPLAINGVTPLPPMGYKV